MVICRETRLSIGWRPSLAQVEDGMVVALRIANEKLKIAEEGLRSVEAVGDRAAVLTAREVLDRLEAVAGG